MQWSKKRNSIPYWSLTTLSCQVEGLEYRPNFFFVVLVTDGWYPTSLGSQVRIWTTIVWPKFSLLRNVHKCSQFPPILHTQKKTLAILQIPYSSLKCNFYLDKEPSVKVQKLIRWRLFLQSIPESFIFFSENPCWPNKRVHRNLNHSRPGSYNAHLNVTRSPGRT